MTVPTIFESISDQPEATALDGLFFAAESASPSDPTVKVPLSLITNQISSKNLISNSSFDSAGGVTNPPDSTARSYSADDELFKGMFAVGTLTGVTYIDGKLSGTGQIYTDIFKSEKQKLSTSAHIASIASSDGLPIESSASVADNGDYWRVTFDMNNTFSVKLEMGSIATSHFTGIDGSVRDYVKSTKVSQYRLAPDADWSNAIDRAMAVGSGTIEFDKLPNGEKYEHVATISFSTDIVGAGTVRYNGSGDAYTPTESINVSSVLFESAGGDTAMWNITAQLGIKFMNGAHTTLGNYNILVNGVTSQLSIDDGAACSYARTDNVKIIQAKRSAISGNAFIYGANGWGVNIDSTTALAPDQMHGLVIEPQLWGNAAGGIRCVGRNTSGDKSDWVQHPTLGGHIDHNSNDIDPSQGMYLRYITRPVLQAVMIRAHIGYGMDMDYVDFPVIANRAYWKNSADFLIGPNVTGRTILPYSGDFNGVDNSASKGSAYGRNCEVYGDVTANGGVYNFGLIGYLKQFQTGGGAGNAELNLNSASGKNLVIKNQAHLDAKLLVEGHIGTRVFAGAPPGSLTHHAQAYDENGQYIGTTGIYTT